MLLERGHANGSVTGLAALTVGDYRFALSPLVGFMFVGLIASLLLKEPSTETMTATALASPKTADVGHS